MTHVLSIAIGAALILLGIYLLRTLDPPLGARVGLGAVLLAAGAYAFAYEPGLSALMESPVQYGAVIACIGLGINQIAAPLRRALAKPA